MNLSRNVKEYIRMILSFAPLSLYAMIFSYGFVSAQVETYPGQIFEVVENRIGEDGVSKLGIIKSDLHNTVITIEDHAGIISRINVGVLAREIRDIKVGDVDNDGEDEIAFVNKTTLFILEREKGSFILDTSKTTPLYGPNRKGKQDVISPRIESDYVMLLSEESMEAGKLAIGDVNNDGKNEIVITRTFLYPSESQTIVPQLICSNDILQWQKDHFEVIDAIIAGDYKAGIFIVDIDKDGLNELVIGGTSAYVFKSVQRPLDHIESDPTRWWYKALNGGFTIYCVIEFGTNGGDQRIAIKERGNRVFISYCTIWDIGKSYIHNIGNIKTFELDPKMIWERELIAGAKKQFNIKEFYELREPYKLVISRYKNTNFPFVRLNSIILGDKDNDGEDEVIANMEDEALIINIKYPVK